MLRSRVAHPLLALSSFAARGLLGSLGLLGLLGLIVLTSLAACSGNSSPAEPSSQLAFGTSMAQRGLWSEALFRFREAERADPDNPRVQNDLAVAYEASGEFEKALEHYQKALKLDASNRQVKNNYARFVEFYQSFRPKAAKNLPVPAAVKSNGPKAGERRSSAGIDQLPDVVPESTGEPEPQSPTPPPPSTPL